MEGENCIALCTQCGHSVSVDASHLLKEDALQAIRDGRTPSESSCRAHNAAAGEEHTYSWKEYVAEGTGTGSNFFHLMQIFDAVKGGPVVTLTARKGMVGVESGLCGGGCPSAAWESYVGRTTLHTMR